jgi:hypothetical protein
VLNATFSNISTISWGPVLVLKEAGVPGENHRPWASNWYSLSLAAASRVHLFCNLQSGARTHAVLVIGLYELLGNLTNSLSHPGPCHQHEIYFQVKDLNRKRMYHCWRYISTVLLKLVFMLFIMSTDLTQQTILRI